MVHVLYRMSPFAAINGRTPVHAGDKPALARMCLESFAAAFAGTSVHVTFLLDSCPDDYEALVREVVTLPATVERHEGLGNLGSFRLQLDRAAALPADAPVLLAEDDYLWRPGAGAALAAALAELEFVTPYDHGGHYEEPWSRFAAELRLCAGRHWRTQASTTLTFGARAGLLARLRPIVEAFGVDDHAMWQEARRHGWRLWNPLPALATHLDGPTLAPAVDWGLAA